METEPSQLALPDDWSVNALRWQGGLTPSDVFCEVLDWPQLPDYLVDYHSGIEFGILLEGRMLRQFEDYGFEIGPGEVWLCAMWEPHGWGKISAEGKDMVFVFLPEFLGDEKFADLSWLNLFAAPPSERPRVVSDDMRNTMLSIGHNLANEIIKQRPMWRSLIRFGLLWVLTLLARGWKPQANSQAQKKIRAGDLSRIIPALDLVHQQPLKTVKLTEAACACGFSRGHFAQMFQHAMGISFHRFQQRSRLGLVARRLIGTELSVEAIASEAGFFNASHLINAFIKHYGCTPSQYRRQAR